jgi:thioredoxin-like negative regulator of GroEL
MVIPIRQWWMALFFAGLLWGCQRPAAGPGAAQIGSTPPGAMVFIDDHFVGLTPQVVQDLSPGVHSVKLERWGYCRYSGLLTVGEGPARLEVALQEQKSGEIRIASVPSEATVMINGRRRGRTPLVISGLTAGGYEIRLQLDNCDPWLRTAQLRTAEKMAINAALESPQERFLLDAIARKPKEVTNYTELARHYIIRKKYDQAVGVYKSALQQRDKAMDSRLYQEMGRAYGGQFKSFEDDADMEALHARMIRLFAEAGNAMTFYASAQKYASERPRSHNPGAEKAELEKIQALEQALDQKPDDLAARLELARLYLDRRDSRHAQEQF